MAKVIPKRNLLLAFDAFGTLFTPKQPIEVQYGDLARKHGLFNFTDQELGRSFRNAFKQESKINPNYGKAVDMGTATWWGNVIARTFQPFLSPDQHLPSQLVPDLLTRFSTKDGYAIYPDVLPFFRYLQQAKSSSHAAREQGVSWPWEKTVIGIISNSDDRVQGILRSLGLKVGIRKVGSTEERIADASVDDDVSFVVLSYDVGYEKPDRRIFDAARQLLQDVLKDTPRNSSKVSSDEFEYLYIGDEWEKDYLAAQNAGWHALFLDREGEHVPKDRSNTAVGICNVDIMGRSGQAIRELDAVRFWRPGVS